MRKALASAMCRLAHTGVRQLACVSRIGACGIYLELLCQAPCKDLLAENLLRHWRTTDISKTDEKYLVFHH